jgi:hypothetical protein
MRQPRLDRPAASRRTTSYGRADRRQSYRACSRCDAARQLATLRETIAGAGRASAMADARRANVA